MSKELTSRSIEKLAPKEKRYNELDSRVRGLGVAVYPSSQKTFYHVRKIFGRPERTTLASFPEMSLEQARGRAEELNGKLSKWKNNDFQGVNPLRRPKGEPTLDELLTDYCERGLPRSLKCRRPERAAADAKWQITKYVSAWKNRKLNQIQRRDIVDLHQRLKEESGPYSANRVLQCLRAMFNWAVHPDSGLWSGANPCSKIALFGEQERKRFLDKQERERLFAALAHKKTTLDLRDYVLLALSTGARKSDVLSMRSSDVKLYDNRWDVPDSKTGEYVIPLTPEAKAILKIRLRSRKNQNDIWVFPSFGQEGHIVDLKGAWAQLLERAKITDLRQHDLRRTLGSIQAQQGSSIPIIGKSLGHKSLDATEIYSQLDLGAVRTSMESATATIFAAGKKKVRLLKAAING